MKYGMPYKGSKNKLAGQIFELFPLTNEKAEKINIWKEKLENCPLKKVDCSIIEVEK